MALGVFILCMIVLIFLAYVNGDTKGKEGEPGCFLVVIIVAIIALIVYLTGN